MVRYLSRLPYAQRRAASDSIALGVVAACVVYVCFAIDAFERLAAWSERHERWNVDELIVVLLMLAVPLIIFAVRRWQDLRLELHARIAAEIALRHSEARFRSLVQNASDAVIVLSADGAFQYISPSAERLLGYSPAEWLGRPAFIHVHPDDIARVAAGLEVVLANTAELEPIEFRYRHADGSWRHLEALATNLLDDPAVAGIVENVRDITDRKELEERLTYQAYHDPLTELPNRSLFADRLNRALAASEQPGAVAVLFLDLDGFKVVNDSLGHSTGDALLAAVAHRLAGCLRPVDTIARIGGDEFAVLVTDTVGVVEATAIGERLLAAIQAPIAIEGRQFVVTASLGIARSSADVAGQTPDDLLREADIALYQAKEAGKNCIAVFDPAMQASAIARLELERDLRGVVSRQELEVHYQPEVDLHTGDIVGVEALVRWNHPRRGMISPVEFIPVAEESGLILQIGEWVLREACNRAQAWRQVIPRHRPFVLSVNLSAREFQCPDLVPSVAAILQETGLEPSALCLEITETAAVQDMEVAVAKMEALKRLGVQLALDDFGTGYSSLNYLRRFPVNVLKIDRSFVRELDEGGITTAIVQSICTLARLADIDVIAEGIETPEQLEFVRSTQCRRGQGFYFAKPLPAEAIDGLLHRGLPTEVRGQMNDRLWVVR